MTPRRSLWHHPRVTNGIAELLARSRSVSEGTGRLHFRLVVLAKVWLAIMVLCGIAGVVGSIRFDHHGQAAFAPLLLAVPVVGALIMRHRPAHPIGWIFLVGGSAAVLGLLIEADRWSILGPGPRSSWPSLFGDVLWPLTFPLLSASLLWFPDGHLPSRRWLPAAVALLAAIAAIVVGSAISVWEPQSRGGLQNPLGVVALSDRYPLPLLFPAQSLLVLFAIASVPLRYRHSDSDQRSQIRWVLWATLVALGSIGVIAAVALFGQVPEWLNGLAAFPIVVGMPVCVGIAILRHRLFDIDLLINRTLLYLGLSVALLGLYVGVVTTLSLSFRPDPWVSPAAAALLVALVFHPFRVRAQEFADRRLFGDRSDPLRVLEQVSASVSGSGAQYTELAAAIGGSLRLHHVAIDLIETSPELEPRRIATFGEPRSAPLVTVPITRDQSMLGSLVVAARSQHDPLRPGEVALLTAIASQIAATLETERLARAVQTSRERIVQATEEERRRLRRDLHDGLGAQLTAIGYGVAAAVQAVQRTGTAAPGFDLLAVLEGTKGELIDAVAELRRMIDGLRPGPLDELGLADALISASQHLLSRAGITFYPDVPKTLRQGSSFEAATESALYRIGLEAVTNVVRHSGAKNCWLRLSIEDAEITLRVEDDGIGPPHRHVGAKPHASTAGVGIASMFERVDELGGSASILRRPGTGTIVKVRLLAVPQ